MSTAFAWLAAVLLALAGPGGDTRLWTVEVELEGPLARVVLDCGADGETRLAGALVAGERRRLAVPVPVRSPLGTAGLGPEALPTITGEGGGAARVLGWAGAQPIADLERLGPAGRELRARPRPPLVDGVAGAAPAPAELLVLAGAFALALAARRRAPAVLALGLVAGAVLLWRPQTRGAAVELRVWECDLGRGRAVLVRGGAGELDARGASVLEVAPAGRAMVLELGLAGGGIRALAPGAALWAVQPAEPPAIGPAENGWRSLEAVWVRSPRGDWSGRGPWPRGASLMPDPSGAAAAAEPPGWLKAGLPPGRGVLLARLAPAPDGGAGTRWLRAVGFEP